MWAEFIEGTGYELTWEVRLFVLLPLLFVGLQSSSTRTERLALTAFLCDFYSECVLRLKSTSGNECAWMSIITNENGGLDAVLRLGLGR
jgi:hypothetical protein